MTPMKTIRFLILGALALAVAGCAHTVPSELVNARAAYERSANGPAARLVPAELHIAREALAKAERSFKDEPKSYRARDLAYVAERKCQAADALASIAADQGKTVQAKDDFSTTQGEIVKQTRADLTDTKASLTETKASLGETRATLDRTHAALMEALAKLAAVKEEPRGMVITLSGSVLFKSGESSLLASANNRLGQVADALLANRESSLVVEGHTDSQGSDSSNMALSQRRADTVRNFLIGRGYPGDLIMARGVGEGSPVADNATAEGRSNNRRVEIIIQRQAASEAGGAQ